MKKLIKDVPREQSGIFGISIYANLNAAIFRDDEERTTFMKCLFESANRYEGKIMDFILEDTHIHLLVFAKYLSKMIGYALRNFSRIHNRKHHKAGNLFVSPFQSFPITSDKQLMNQSFYIMYNAVAAGQCTHPKDYKWCSWKYHFREGDMHIDTSFVDSLFKDMNDYEKSYFAYQQVREHCRKSRDANGRYLDVQYVNPAGDPDAELGDGYRRSGLVRNTDDQVLVYLSKILEGKDVYALEPSERERLAERLFRETYASRRQVASALCLSWDHADDIYKMMVISGWNGERALEPIVDVGPPRRSKE